MFQGLSKQHLKQLHKKWKRIYGTITVPNHSLVAKGRKELEAIFMGLFTLNTLGRYCKRWIMRETTTIFSQVHQC